MLTDADVWCMAAASRRQRELHADVCELHVEAEERFFSIYADAC
jgi:hypothetical protein